MANAATTATRHVLLAVRMVLCPFPYAIACRSCPGPSRGRTRLSQQKGLARSQADSARMLTHTAPQHPRFYTTNGTLSNKFDKSDWEVNSASVLSSRNAGRRGDPLNSAVNRLRFPAIESSPSRPNRPYPTRRRFHLKPALSSRGHAQRSYYRGRGSQSAFQAARTLSKGRHPQGVTVHGLMAVQAPDEPDASRVCPPAKCKTRTKPNCTCACHRSDK
jgi:hypothetical protein